MLGPERVSTARVTLGRELQRQHHGSGQDDDRRRERPDTGVLWLEKLLHLRKRGRASV